jgi:carbon monoxide dehydrogenase subunit G
MRISNVIEIENTPESVFSWLEDPRRAIQWMTSVSKTEIIEETADKIGTTFREVVEENGRGTELRGVVTDFVLNKRISFHLEGDFNTVDVSYTLEDKGGITQLRQNAEIHFKGASRLMSILMGPSFKKKILEQAQREFNKLKELCEQDIQK